MLNVVLGSGLIGSYLTKRLLDKGESVTLIELNTSGIKNEKQVNKYIRARNYKGTSVGRCFALGGTTNLWGGQLIPMQFIEVDEYFSTKENYLECINNVLRNLEVEGRYEKKEISYQSNEHFELASIWLNPGKRNMWRDFESHQNFQLINGDVQSINARQITYLVDGELNEMNLAGNAKIWVCLGFFECFRVLSNSKLISSQRRSFNDHLSFKVFKIKNRETSFINRLIPRFEKGYMRTPRIHFLKKNDLYAYCHLVYDLEQVRILKIVKNFWFGEITLFKLIKSLNRRDIPELVAMVYYRFVKKKLYIPRNVDLYLALDLNSWTHTIDINGDNLCIDFELGTVEFEAVSKLKTELINLAGEQILEELSDLSVKNNYDVYHPCGLLNIDEYNELVKNRILVVGTPSLKHAGTANPGLSSLAIIENLVYGK